MPFYYNFFLPSLRSSFDLTILAFPMATIPFNISAPMPVKSEGGGVSLCVWKILKKSGYILLCRRVKKICKVVVVVVVAVKTQQATKVIFAV